MSCMILTSLTGDEHPVRHIAKITVINLFISFRLQRWHPPTTGAEGERWLGGVHCWHFLSVAARWISKAPDTLLDFFSPRLLKVGRISRRVINGTSTMMPPTITSVVIEHSVFHVVRFADIKNVPVFTRLAPNYIYSRSRLKVVGVAPSTFELISPSFESHFVLLSFANVSVQVRRACEP